jgi:tripartite ATP-independent transporter DctM subunit
MIIGSIVIVVVLILVCAGFPIAWALFLAPLGGLLYMLGLDQTLAISAAMLYNSLSQYEFSVIAMFVLMGNIGFYSGLFTEVFEVARKWFGRLPAGLAVSVVMAQAIFGACSGSSVAACVVVGKAALPTMRKMKYPDELSTGVIAASGTLAVLIPPSVTMCIYGVIVDESIGKLLIAGIIPGLLNAAIYITMLMIQSRNVPRDVERFTFMERLASLRHMWVVLMLVVALTGGIYSGICTPTEGGAFGAFVMFLLALVANRVNRTMMWQSIRSTIQTTGMILIIVAGAVLFSRVLAVSGFTHEMTDWVTTMQVSKHVIFLLVAVIYFLLGCFVGSTAMMVMTLPTFYPLMISLGYDSIWFGIMVIVMCEMAFTTPPVGINLYATKDIAKVPLSVVIRGVIPFLWRDTMVLVLLYLFPIIATWLPSMM